ncbi:uncharacterized protein [Prorops nasuta]|uniref:uncharacterized protein isoform X2 n=1 Tax=Prorops nasuta TaxID=863751 RepID=UPI0034CD8982
MLSAILPLTCLSVIAAADKGCRISLNYKDGDLPEKQPLILSPQDKNVIYPDQSYAIFMKSGEEIQLACPGYGNYFENIGPRQQEVLVTCVGGKSFRSNHKVYTFTDLHCKEAPKHIARRTPEKCLTRHSFYEVGFDLNDKFLRTLEICRDERTLTTYYSKNIISKDIKFFQHSFPRPTHWQQGPFYPNVNMQSAYYYENQIASFSRILNSENLARKYFNKHYDYYLARGHLTAKADYVFGAMQRTTFWYLNSAPQWQCFNAGNWNSIESSVRDFIIKRGLKVEVYTGVHGQMTLPDINGVRQKMFLHADNKKKAIVVPKFYWKIIYYPEKELGIALIGLNNPFEKLSNEETYICPDISSKINWVSWHPENVTLGVSYACKVNDLQAVVPTVPHLRISGVLL